MSAPTSINFDGLVDENNAVPTWQGGGWTVSFLNGTSIEAIDLNNNIAPISTGSDYALFVVGDAPGLGGDAVSFAGTSGEEFLLQSFAIMRYEAGSDSMDPDIRVVGYRNGSPVAGALQDFSLPTNGSLITVTFSGAAWDGIDEFRIVQQNGTRDFYFLIDDIAVGSTTLDTTPPTATIVVADTALKIGETTGVTITFSEAVTGFTNADLIIANGTLSAVSSSDGGVTWTATFTPSANITDTTNLITLDNSGVVDWAGNAGSGTTDSNNYAVDTMRPTATIVVADSALGVGQTSLVTITFSEAVTGFTNADLTIANGTLSAVSSSDGGVTWTATLTPTANITDPSNLITLDNTGVVDAAGNAGSGTTDSNNYAIDTVRPTATIVVADTALQIGETTGVT
ncbi:Ig-like domain-containing protein, partial [Streptomyces nigra]|uniref:Ig-like domain-containing protein n=1 Tax=Streptomyces nigra TaxID=1827580 RepID=UPI0036A86C5D